MTISVQTATKVAEKIVRRAKDSGVADSLALALGMVEDIMEVNGNKSFQSSLVLIHKAVKDCFLKNRGVPNGY